jgi:hypothetical protein
MSFVTRKVQHGAADYDIGKVTGKIHLFDWPHTKVARRQVWRELRCQGAHVLDSFGVSVYSEDLASFTQKMDEVSSIAATSVKHTHSGRDVSSQDLIEDVNINLPELILHVHRGLTLSLLV